MRLSCISVSGQSGLVGSPLIRRLERNYGVEILPATRQQLDLRGRAAVSSRLRANRREYLDLVADTVGNILANSTRPSEFIYRATPRSR